MGDLRLLPDCCLVYRSAFMRTTAVVLIVIVLVMANEVCQ